MYILLIAGTTLASIVSCMTLRQLKKEALSSLNTHTESGNYFPYKYNLFKRALFIILTISWLIVFSLSLLGLGL